MKNSQEAIQKALEKQVKKEWQKPCVITIDEHDITVHIEVAARSICLRHSR